TARLNTAKRLRIESGMPETPEKSEKKLSVPSKPLSLKGRGVEQGMVRQAFSHGRTKTVVVEKVKSRAPARPKADAAAGAAKQPRGRQGGGGAPRRGHSGSGCAGAEAFRRGAADADRGGAHRPGARPGRRPSARGRGTPDRGRGSAAAQNARDRGAQRARCRGSAQGRRGEAPKA